MPILIPVMNPLLNDNDRFSIVFHANTKTKYKKLYLTINLVFISSDFMIPEKKTIINRTKYLLFYSLFLTCFSYFYSVSCSIYKIEKRYL